MWYVVMNLKKVFYVQVEDGVLAAFVPGSSWEQLCLMDLYAQHQTQCYIIILKKLNLFGNIG